MTAVQTAPVAQASPKAFVLMWKDLDKWDFLSNYLKTSFNSRHEVVPLSEICSVRFTLVDKTNIASGDVTLVDKVSFSGEVFAGLKEATKMQQYLALPDDILVSKIRARQGSVGLVENSHGKVCVSIHYRVLIVNTAMADRFYLWLALRSSYAKSQFLAVTGGAAKGEISESELMKIQVPLPPLHIQQAIVDKWQRAQREIAGATARLAALEAHAKQNFLEQLGIEKRVATERPKYFALPWAELERWSVEYLSRAVVGLNAPQTGTFETKTLSEVCSAQSGGTPSKKRPDYWKGEIPWVSPKDMKRLELFDAQDHISEEAVKDSSAPLIPESSVLVVVRSGILQRLVPVAINRVPVSINQDMRAFTLRDKSLSPDFLAYYLDTRQEDLLRLVKWSTTVQSINKEEFESFPVPIPPLEIQQKLVAELEQRRAEITLEHKHLEAKTKEVERSVSSLILGLESV